MILSYPDQLIVYLMASKHFQQKSKYNLSSRISLILLAVAVSIITFIIYGQSRHFGTAIDDHLIFDTMINFSSGWSGFSELIQTRYNISDYRPVTLASFQIERLLFGQLKPGTSHMVNVFIYMVTLWLMIVLLYQIILTNRRYCGKELKLKQQLFVITFAVVLFCVHPIHANVVSSIKNRDTLLSMFFGLASISVLFKMLNEGKGSRIKAALYVIPFMLFFLMAYFSKRDAIGIIVLAPLIIILFRPSKWKLVTTIIISCLAVLFFYVRMTNHFAPITQNDELLFIVTFTENPVGGSLIDRVTALFSTFFLYLKSFIYPKEYLFYYGYNTFEFPFKGGMLVVSIVVGISFLILLFLSTFSKRKNKVLAFGLLFMSINLIYCLNFVVPVAGIYGARLAYVASFGFCISVAVLFLYFPKGILKNAASGAIIILLAWLSFSRCSEWKNFENLLAADLPSLENSYEGNRIAGEVYTAIADTLTDASQRPIYYEKAIKHLSYANNMYDKGWRSLFYEGYAHYRLGNTNKAISLFEKSMEVSPIYNTYTAEILGDAYYFTNDYSSAKKTYENIWKNDPTKQYILNKISNTYYIQNDMQGAVVFNDSLIKAQPELYYPYEQLGLIMLQKADTAQALIYLSQALKNGLNNPQVEQFVKLFSN